MTLLAAAIGAAGSIEAREFYATLQQPSWAPPGWVFGPVWTTLYVLMAVAAAKVWLAGSRWENWRALVLFAVQLVFNAVWSWVFFVWKRGALAFADIILLWVLVSATLVQFWRVRRVAGILLVPYLSWVTFASLLCYAVWMLNPGKL